MLGFSTISEVPLSQAATALVALAYLPSATFQGFTAAVLTDAQAKVTPSSVTSTTTASALLYDSKASIVFAEAVAAFDMNAILDYDAKSRVTPSASVSTTTAGTLQYDAVSHVTMAGAVGFGAANAFGDVDAQASASTTGVTSSGAVSAFESLHGKANYTPIPAVATFTPGVLEYDAIAFIDIPTGVTAAVDITNFEDVDAQARITPTGATAISAVNAFDDVDAQARVVPASTAAYLSIYIGNFADEDAQATAFIPTVGSTTNASQLDFDAQSRITPSNVTAGIIASDLLTDAQANVTFSSIDLTLFRNLETPTGIRFPYQDYADQYHRGRTLYVTAYDSSYTVHILEQNNVVYIDKPQGSYTVHILEQNNIVYIDKPQGSNTVYIAA
jgi:hypothetical protein